MTAAADLIGDDYLRPIDFHSHGVGRFDFFDVSGIALDEVEHAFRREGVRAILTLYLPRHQYEPFLKFMDVYAEGCARGRFPNIAGIALEGPLLASHGGTPEQGVWAPTKKEWRAIADCGRKGLQYVVFSPDADFASAATESESQPSLSWLVQTLMDGRVRPAPGHFKKSEPDVGARRVKELFEIVAARGDMEIVSDHLFNDMPLNFRHCWRTAADRVQRTQGLAEIDLEGWSLSNMTERLGVVPAALLEGARDGLARLCINFDGEHVDLAISKRIVDLVGANYFLLMTDQIQSRVLAGRRLTEHADNTLLYQEKGIVAGGSQPVARQIANMRGAGFTKETIRKIAVWNPNMLLGVGGVVQAAEYMTA